MADRKISELPTPGTLSVSDTDVLPMVIAGTTYQVAAGAIAALTDLSSTLAVDGSRDMTAGVPYRLDFSVNGSDSITLLGAQLYDTGTPSGSPLDLLTLDAKFDGSTLGASTISYQGHLNVSDDTPIGFDFGHAKQISTDFVNTRHGIQGLEGTYRLGVVRIGDGNSIPAQGPSLGKTGHDLFQMVTSDGKLWDLLRAGVFYGFDGNAIGVNLLLETVPSFQSVTAAQNDGWPEGTLYTLDDDSTLRLMRGPFAYPNRPTTVPARIDVASGQASTIPLHQVEVYASSQPTGNVLDIVTLSAEFDFPQNTITASTITFAGYLDVTDANAKGTIETDFLRSNAGMMCGEGPIRLGPVQIGASDGTIIAPTSTPNAVLEYDFVTIARGPFYSVNAPLMKVAVAFDGFGTFAGNSVVLSNVPTFATTTDAQNSSYPAGTLYRLTNDSVLRIKT